MSTFYRIKSLLKVSEEDVWLTGCTGKSQASNVDLTWEATTLTGLFEKVCNDIGYNGSCEYLDDFNEDEAGRIDFQQMECADGTFVTPSELKRWKNGTLRLWLCNYVGKVTKITYEDVNLKEVLKDERARGIGTAPVSGRPSEE